MTQQTKGQTPETDARTFLSFDPYDLRDDELKVVDAEFARKLETQRDSLLAALEWILVHSDTTMATSSRDIFNWQDDNRVIGDKARTAISAVKEGK